MIRPLPDNGVTGGPPWADPAQWRDLNRRLERACAVGHDQARQAALALAGLLGQADALLDELCAAACPWCPTPCCLEAKVWLDRRDLLFIHLGGQSPPPAQLRQGRHDHCRYLGPRGCRLPRLQRPWVCTWYLCPTLSARLAGRPGQQARWQGLVAAIKEQRRLIGALMADTIL
ncbi:conserved hypothetical protein [Desulfarculus baarsii DSM 2075]|uniref:Uncharacterized protein n=1 Tax=Desulfarculus baarsii (strain ATCC 33931 / DSM 2075 / LMG 7858 / VKM B-1802 / 2st14) TaxID=644282 RepID=E1QER6_DESB2|nr:hypothetical protein [Desulfarculus baarsii]ADK84052.1 conserved hypothetical protein [Desulfarculus baarsii DSM 2075]